MVSGQLLISSSGYFRETLPHLTFDVELLGDCDRIVNQLCLMLENDEWLTPVHQPRLTQHLGLPQQLQSHTGTAGEPQPQQLEPHTETAGEPQYQQLQPRSGNTGEPQPQQLDSHPEPTGEPQPQQQNGQVSKSTEDNTANVVFSMTGSDRHESNTSGGERDCGLKSVAEENGTHDVEKENGKDEFEKEKGSEDVSASANEEVEETKLKSLADFIPEGNFLYLPPSRYIFPGAEIYPDDSDIEDDAEDEDDDDEEEEEEEEEEGGDDEDGENNDNDELVVPTDFQPQPYPAEDV